MAKKDLPSPEVLRQLLRYEPETGKLIWRPRGAPFFAGGDYPADRLAKSWNGRFAGKDAGTVHAKGYRYIKIDSQCFAAHRIVVAMVSGEWPTYEIDHIDHDKLNNRMSNLRIATRSENARNMPKHRSNKSGHNGVVWNKKTSKWRAFIGVNGRNIHLGSFDKIEDAINARIVANKEYGYAIYHGQ